MEHAEVAGAPSGQQLVEMASSAPPGSVFAVAAVGQHQLERAHRRVGGEDFALPLGAGLARLGFGGGCRCLVFAFGGVLFGAALGLALAALQHLEGGGVGDVTNTQRVYVDFAGAELAG